METRERLWILLAAICLVLVLSPAFGQVQAGARQQAVTDFDVIDEYVAAQRVELNIPGMALGIVQDGRVAHLEGYGVADSSGRAVTPQTPFRIGSATKSFTALAVMQLVEAGKIDLDAPVQSYLPWFEVADKEASAKITVRHLLTHTSGISPKDGDRFWASREGLEETLRGLKSIRLTHPVGTTYQYSNLNYSIAGLLIETVSGQSYGDYVRRQIFEPLDMRHSYSSQAIARADGLAQGHRYMLGHPFASESPTPPPYLPSGFLIASAEDMAHWLLAHLSDGRYGDVAVLSPQGMAELHAPAAPMEGGHAHYAMGWNVGSEDGAPYLWHNGALRDAWSEIVLLPAEGLGVVLLANANGFEQLTQVTMVAEGVISLLKGETPDPIKLYFPLRFLYWTLLLMPVPMIVGVAYFWRKWRARGIGHPKLVAGLYGGIALLWLFGVPPLARQQLGSGMRVWYPELFYSLLAAAALGIGWTIVYSVAIRRAPRSKRPSGRAECRHCTPLP